MSECQTTYCTKSCRYPKNVRNAKHIFFNFLFCLTFLFSELLSELREQNSRKSSISIPNGASQIGISEQALNLLQNSKSKTSKSDSTKMDKEPLEQYQLQVGPSVPQNGQQLQATVWMPPKPRLEEIKAENEVKSQKRSITEESEYYSRSESSTPNPKLSSANPSHANTPVALTDTYCCICEVNFDTGVQLQVHYLGDHCTMKDGKDFKCPTRNCDKIFSSKPLLRKHLVSHFSGK